METTWREFSELRVAKGSEYHILRSNVLGKDERLIKINIFDERFYILYLRSTNFLYNFKQKKVIVIGMEENSVVSSRCVVSGCCDSSLSRGSASMDGVCTSTM